MTEAVMRLDSILCCVFFTLLVTLWGPTYSEAKPVETNSMKDSEFRREILKVIDRLLEKRLAQQNRQSTSTDDISQAVKGNIRQKKQDEPSPFFGPDYDYARRSKKAWLSNDREQDEPSPIFPESRWNERAKKSEVSRDLLDKLINIWKLQKQRSVDDSSSDNEQSTEKILNLLGQK